jgi:hypothetical protein
MLCAGVNTFFGRAAALIGSTHNVANIQKVGAPADEILTPLASSLLLIIINYF